MPATIPANPDHGLLVLLPAERGGAWRCWRIAAGGLDRPALHVPGDDPPWGDLAEDARIVVLVPAADAPVRILPRPSMPLPQALAAARLEAGGARSAGLPSGEAHVVAAAGEDGRSILVATVAPALMDLWLAELAAAGLYPQVLAPAALALPPVREGAVVASLEGQPVARTPAAAFAGEEALLDALAPGERRVLEGADLAAALLGLWREPALNLRQGAYAPRQVSFFRLPDWLQLARMGAVAALLGFLILSVETIKLNADARAREHAALAAARQRFPAAVDLTGAQTLAAAELARRGQGGGTFAAPAAAVLAAMRQIPSLNLRDLGYGADGVLRFQAAAPRAEDINRLLVDLQRDGWQVTVPPQLAPDPTGATVAAITVRAP